MAREGFCERRDSTATKTERVEEKEEESRVSEDKMQQSEKFSETILFFCEDKTQDQTNTDR